MHETLIETFAVKSTHNYAAQSNRIEKDKIGTVLEAVGLRADSNNFHFEVDLKLIALCERAFDKGARKFCSESR